MGGSLNVGYNWGTNKITLKNTYNRRFSDKYFIYEGINGENNTYVNDYYAQTLVTNFSRLTLLVSIL